MQIHYSLPVSTILRYGMRMCFHIQETIYSLPLSKLYYSNQTINPSYKEVGSNTCHELACRFHSHQEPEVYLQPFQLSAAIPYNHLL